MKNPPFLKFEEMLPILRSLLTMVVGSLEDAINLEQLKEPAEQELRYHLISKFIEMRMGPEMPSQDALVEAILSYGVQLQSHTAKEIAKALADGERISALRDSSNSGNSDVMIGEIPTFSPLPKLKISGYIPVAAEGNRVLMRKKKANVTAEHLILHENYFIYGTA